MDPLSRTNSNNITKLIYALFTHQVKVVEIHKIKADFTRRLEN